MQRRRRESYGQRGLARSGRVVGSREGVSSSTAAGLEAVASANLGGSGHWDTTAADGPDGTNMCGLAFCGAGADGPDGAPVAVCERGHARRRRVFLAIRGGCILKNFAHNDQTGRPRARIGAGGDGNAHGRAVGIGMAQYCAAGGGSHGSFELNSERRPSPTRALARRWTVIFRRHRAQAG